MLMTKGLQGKNTTIEWDGCGKIGNKSKLIIIAIKFPFSRFYGVHIECCISFVCVVDWLIMWTLFDGGLRATSV